MVNNTMKANYGDMRNNAAAITKAASDYKTNVNKLFQEVEQLSDAWKGEDNQEYVKTVSTYRQDMTTLGVAVDGYADFLRKAANTLNNTQDEIRNMAGRL